MKKIRKIISGLLIILIVIMAIGCEKPVTEASPIEDSEEITTIEETTEEATTTEEETEVAEELAETTEETTEEVEEKYFTYEVKYEEPYSFNGNTVKLITDKTFPGTLRVSLADDLPETFFERIDCKSSEECLTEVIQEVLNSLENKEIILRDTRRGTSKFSVVDTKKPVEIVFKYVSTKEEEVGPLHLPLWDEELGIPYKSYTFVCRPDGGLRFISYYSPKYLEDTLSIPSGKYNPSGHLNWMVTILKFHPEVLGWAQIYASELHPTEKEENFSKKVHLVFEEVLEYDEEQNLYVEKQEYQGILTLKGER